MTYLVILIQKIKPLNYRSVTIDVSTNLVLKKVNDKNIKLIDNTFNYTGVAFIKNYSDFKDFLENMSTQIGETDYFMNLDPTSIKIRSFLKITTSVTPGRISDL